MSEQHTSRGTSRAPASQRGTRGATAVGTRGIGATVEVVIDGQSVRVPLGTTILDAARLVGVEIPTLCYHQDLCVAGVCRLCAVEVAGEDRLQAACSYPITSPVEVRTHTPEVRRARRHLIDLLLSRSGGSCVTCPANGSCEVQRLAGRHGIESLIFGRSREVESRVDESGPGPVRDAGRCVLCRRCVRACIDLQEVGVLEAIGRSDETVISAFAGKPMADVICIQCGQCVARCPTGALRDEETTGEVWEALDAKETHVVIQTSAGPRAAVAEAFGEEPGTDLSGEMTTAARRLGFDAVIDSSAAEDLVVLAGCVELVRRMRRGGPLPLMTSGCPAWVRYLEHFHPDQLERLSPLRSPQQVLGELIKTRYAREQGLDPARVVSVALIPCAARRLESNRPEMSAGGLKHVDCGLTVRELATMIGQAGIVPSALPRTDFDEPLGAASGSGMIGGVTGGAMEALLRTLVEWITGRPIEQVLGACEVTPVRGFDGVRYLEIPLDGRGEAPPQLEGVIDDWDWLEDRSLRIGICHGTANAKKVIEDIEAGGAFAACHAIEVMACPGGCIGGGGLPSPTSPEIRSARAGLVFASEDACRVRKAHENRVAVELYDRLREDDRSGALHTGYTVRGKFIA